MNNNMKQMNRINYSLINISSNSSVIKITTRINNTTNSNKNLYEKPYR